MPQEDVDRFNLQVMRVLRDLYSRRPNASSVAHSTTGAESEEEAYQVITWLYRQGFVEGHLVESEPDAAVRSARISEATLSAYAERVLTESCCAMSVPLGVAIVEAASEEGDERRLAESLMQGLAG